MEQQKQGIVMCITKTSGPNKPADYRSINLMNTDYKIVAQLIVKRLRATIYELLHQSQ
jgi:hypothetical protein